jgi:hypothetical protein
VVAGAVGTACGITSLVSYTALRSRSTAATRQPRRFRRLLGGSTLTSERELTGVKRSLARGLPVAPCGAAFLLSTPPGVFSRVVPFLVATASFSLLAQPG